MRLLCLCALVFTVAHGGHAADGRERVDAAGQALAAALWRHQQADGHFASRHYAMLRSEQALTPVLLRQLMRIPGANDERIARSLGWLRRHIDAHGCVGMADPELMEYPVYATAAALACLDQANDPSDTQRRAILTKWLITAQYDNEEGFSKEHLAHGLWGFGPAQAGRPGFCDIAHSRWVAEVLGDRLPVTNRKALARALQTLQKQPQATQPQPRLDAAVWWPD